MTTILFLMILTPALFIFLKHPLSMGLVLLLKVIFMSLITGMMNYNFWFSYILFMIMVGGMLILFIYMTSVASNEKMKTSFYLTMMTVFILITSTIITYPDAFFMEIMNMNFELSPYTKEDSYLSMSKYMNPPMNKVMLLTIIYLLITLIMVVKVTEINHGPLRQKF